MSVVGTGDDGRDGQDGPDGRDDQALAERSVAQMWAADTASRELGMEVVDVAPGRARIAMTVEERMVNGWSVAHGGMVATLADTAFAAACNSRGELTVAAGFTVDFVAPAHLGDRLVATAREVWLRGRAGLYDVVVAREGGDGSGAGSGEGSGEGSGDVVAHFRGRSRALGRPIGEA